MATSMQFGPEWMRKAPNKSNSVTKDGSATTPTLGARPENGAPVATKRNGTNSGAANLNGPAPVASPSVSSPGAFSFAAAAAATAAAASTSDRHSSSTLSDADPASLVLSNGAALAKDKVSREKLLSLYSTDRGIKSPSTDTPPTDNVSDKLGVTGRKKLGVDREQRRLSAFSELGSGPLSPNLGSEPRGLNARTTSGSSSTGFGSTGTLNWEKADKERPGLFQRASSGALSASANNRPPLSPSISRDRFGGIQGGVLAGVAPSTRKRMDSSDGTSDPGRIARTPRIPADEATTPTLGHGTWSRNNSAFSEAFSSNRPRGKPLAGDGANGAIDSSQPESMSGASRFGRNKDRDRLASDGPIGPPADGSVGFNKFAGYDRKRERQANYKTPSDSGGDSLSKTDGNGQSAFEEEARDHDQNDPGPNASDGIHSPQLHHSLGPDDSDLAHHATSVLGALKLDDDDPLANHSLGSNGDPTIPLPVVPPQLANLWSPETAFWLYRDPAGNVQGPFSALAMQDWYRQSYFTDDLLVRRQQDAEFKPLGQVISLIGNALQPFLIPPRDWLQNPDVPAPAPKENLQDVNPHPDSRTSLPNTSDNSLQHQQPQLSEQAELNQASRFADQMDPARAWPGANQAIQQWPSPMNLGFGSAAPQPISPFIRPDPFSVAQAAALDGRFRTQGEHIAIVRERELQEQRQVAAAAAAARGQGIALGQLVDPFVGGGLGRAGWDAAAGTNWMHHGGLSQFDPGLTAAHGSPLIGERHAFDSFNQRPALDQVGRPWSKGTSTPRSQYEHHQASFPGAGQWEQQAPWTYGSMTPETLSSQLHDLHENKLKTQASKPFSDPIGTPRRSRSPAPSSPAFNQGAFQVPPPPDFQSTEPAAKSNATRKDERPVGTTASDTNKADAEAEPELQFEQQQVPTADLEPVCDETIVTNRVGAPDNLEHQQRSPSPLEKKVGTPRSHTIESEASVPTLEEEPSPEQLWPQSPKAVEFASEPGLSSVPELTLSKKTNEAKASAAAHRETKTFSQRQAIDNAKSFAAVEHAKPASRQTVSSGNVRVVPSEQFRRVKEAETTTSLGQAPLASWLNENANEALPQASKPAPWAIRDDDSANAPGPNLREIQEAEARKLEARKAAEKAAVAAQRARTAAAAAASLAADGLPASMSWGLASVPATKTPLTMGDIPIAGLTSPGPPTPAWNASKATAPKKTLMEIQEEERRRAEKQKQQQQQLQAAQTVAIRKAYADSASRTAVPNVPSNANSAWSVVGAGGKASGSVTQPSATTARPANVTVQRTTSLGALSPSGANAWSVVGAKANSAAPPMTRIASQPLVGTVTPTLGSSALKAKPVAVTTVTSSTVSATSPSLSLGFDPNQPSPEYVKYLKDNLKGLTIKADDFIEMLLSFPLDPSPDVMEIISESVYANSSTLDGRRFAADFVSKRKMDAQGRQQQYQQQMSAANGPFQSKWSLVGSAGGMGSFGSGGASGPRTSTPGSPPIARSAIEIMKGQVVSNKPIHSTNSSSSSSNGSVDSFGGFKVVKAKGNKKRNVN